MSVLAGAEPFELDAGEDAPGGVVLCHGLTGTPQGMRTWGEHLRRAGLSVRCPRLPGHGTRWQDLNATRWEDWYGELERAFDTMLARYRTVVVAGLSMGGTLTIRLAQQRGAELAGIVLVNPSLLTQRAGAQFLPVLARIRPSAKAIADDIKKPGVHELAYDRLPLRAALSMSHLWKLTRAELAKVTAPTLLFHSTIDHVVEPINSRILVEGIRSTDFRAVELTNSYHVATLDNDAETIFSDSAAFVRRLHDESER